jgi:hypothetical protein
MEEEIASERARRRKNYRTHSIHYEMRRHGESSINQLKQNMHFSIVSTARNRMSEVTCSLLAATATARKTPQQRQRQIYFTFVFYCAPLYFAK